MGNNTVSRRQLLEGASAVGVAIAGSWGVGKLASKDRTNIDSKGEQRSLLGKDQIYSSITAANWVPDQASERTQGPVGQASLETGDSETDSSEQVQTDGDLGSSEINQYQGDAANTGYVSSPSLADVNEFDGTTLLEEDTGEGYIVYTENGLIHTNQNKLFSRDEDGNEVWSNSNGATAFGPAVTQNGDVVSSDKFNIYTIDENGVKAKNQEFANDKATILVRDNGNILVNSPAAMGELDPDTLEPVDTIEATLSTGDGATPRTLSVADDRYLLYANEGTVVSYDLQEDETVFERGLPTTALEAQGTAADQDTFYIANTRGKYFGIDVESGDVNGSVDVGPRFSAFSSPVVHEDGTVTFSGTEVVNVDPDDFSENWRSNPPGGVTTTSAVNDTFLRASGAGLQALDMNNNGEIIDTVFEDSRVVAGMATGNSLAAIVDNSDLYRVDLASQQQFQTPAEQFVSVDSFEFLQDDIDAGETSTYRVKTSADPEAQSDIEVTVTNMLQQDDEIYEFAYNQTLSPGEEKVEDIDILTGESGQDSFERINGSAVRADIRFENDSSPGKEQILADGAVNQTKINEPPSNATDLTVRDPPESVVERFDANNDGDINVIELGNAGKEFALGNITITELGKVGQAFARSN